MIHDQRGFALDADEQEGSQGRWNDIYSAADSLNNSTAGDVKSYFESAFFKSLRSFSASSNFPST